MYENLPGNRDARVKIQLHIGFTGEEKNNTCHTTKQINSI
jgi:hypothetical protein